MAQSRESNLNVEGLHQGLATENVQGMGEHCCTACHSFPQLTQNEVATAEVAELSSTFDTVLGTGRSSLRHCDPRQVRG